MENIENIIEENIERQRQMNVKTFELLKKNNTNEKALHSFVNAFYILIEEQVDELKDILEKNDFQVLKIDPLTSDELGLHWYLEAIHTALPNLEAINTMTDKCTVIAGSFSAVYDGWYTQPVTKKMVLVK